MTEVVMQVRIKTDRSIYPIKSELDECNTVVKYFYRDGERYNLNDFFHTSSDNIFYHWMTHRSNTQESGVLIMFDDINAIGYDVKVIFAEYQCSY